MNNFISALLSISVVFSGVALAQDATTSLPSPGLTPSSPFYFLDRLGEALREFFTFNPEGKARLQVEFAAERVAEVKITLETRGVDAPGLDVALRRLQEHIAKAGDIVVEIKASGQDVSELAKSLNDEFKSKKDALEQSFKEQKEALKAREKELKAQILEARRAGDTAKVEALLEELAKVKAEKELLELKEEEQEEALEAEEERLEEELEANEEAEEAIKEAEEERQEVLDEAAEEGVALPAGALSEFNNLLAQAKSAFAAGNFAEAKRLAKEAEKKLDAVEESIEKLEEEKEEEEELK